MFQLLALNVSCDTDGVPSVGSSLLTLITTVPVGGVPNATVKSS